MIILYLVLLHVDLLSTDLDLPALPLKISTRFWGWVGTLRPHDYSSDFRGEGGYYNLETFK